MNPFIFLEPVRGQDFINREIIITQLLDLTIFGQTHGHVWLTGERQVGKTSLLRYIESAYENIKQTITIYGDDRNFKPVIIYTNVQDCDTSEKFYHNLWQGLKNYFDFKLKKQSSSLETLLYALKYTYKNKHYILFLIDEFDAFIQNLNNCDPATAILFLGEFNKISTSLDIQKKSPRVFSCVLSANSNYGDLLKTINIKNDSGSGLNSIGKELSWFSKDQVKHLAKQYLKNNPVKFSDKDIYFCYKLTSGYPFFTQMIFFMLYEKKKQKLKEKDYRKQIKDEYVESIKNTIGTWGGKKMPQHTIDKLKTLGKYAGDKLLTAAIEILVKNLTP